LKKQLSDAIKDPRPLSLKKAEKELKEFIKPGIKLDTPIFSPESVK
jgi:hypothetical protein